MEVPTLESPRLRVRKLTADDLHPIHAILSAAFGEPDLAHDAKALAQRERWLQWTVLAYEQLARLHQPPYGERAIVLKATDELIGAVGYVPCLNQFGRAPTWRDLSVTLESEGAIVGQWRKKPDRFTPDANGDWRRSRIKQVAQGRFGVTIEYLVNSDQMQIKMAVT